MHVQVFIFVIRLFLVSLLAQLPGCHCANLDSRWKDSSTRMSDILASLLCGGRKWWHVHLFCSLCCKLMIWDDEQKKKWLIGPVRANSPTYNEITLWSSCNITTLSHTTLLEQSVSSRAELRPPDVTEYTAQYTWSQTNIPRHQGMSWAFQTACPFQPPNPIRSKAGKMKQRNTNLDYLGPVWTTRR